MRSGHRLRRIALLLLLASGASLAPCPATAETGRAVGWLGVSIAEVGEELSDRLAGTFGYAVGTGVYIADVLKDGPAERGELRRGDVIVRLDAQPIWDVRQLQRLIRSHPIDRSVTLVVLRDATRLRLPVVIGAMPAEARAQLAGERFGFLVREERQRTPGADGSVPTGRLLVGVVEPDSAAALAGLLPRTSSWKWVGKPSTAWRPSSSSLAARSASSSCSWSVRRPPPPCVSPSSFARVECLASQFRWRLRKPKACRCGRPDSGPPTASIEEIYLCHRE